MVTLGLLPAHVSNICIYLLLGGSLWDSTFGCFKGTWVHESPAVIKHVRNVPSWRASTDWLWRSQRWMQMMTPWWLPLKCQCPLVGGGGHGEIFSASVSGECGFSVLSVSSGTGLRAHLWLTSRSSVSIISIVLLKLTESCKPEGKATPPSS